MTRPARRIHLSNILNSSVLCNFSRLFCLSFRGSFVYPQVCIEYAQKHPRARIRAYAIRPYIHF